MNVKTFHSENLIYLSTQQTDFLPVELDIKDVFRAIIICDNSVDENVRHKWAEWLVKSGCNYMMAWGYECSEWDNDVDIACVMAHIEHQDGVDSITTEKTIMTTWHENETLEDVFRFNKLDIELNKVNDPFVLILHFSNEQSKQDIIETYMRIKHENQNN